MKTAEDLIKHQIGKALRSEYYYHEKEVKNIEFQLKHLPTEIEEHKIRMEDISTIYHKLYNEKI